MHYIKEICEILSKSALKCGIDEKLNITFSKREDCLFQCNDAFALAKKYGKNPLELAENIVKNIEKTENYEFSFAKPAFINIQLTDKCLSKLGNEFLKDHMAGIEKHEKKSKIILDYGGLKDF